MKAKDNLPLWSICFEAAIDHAFSDFISVKQWPLPGLLLRGWWQGHVFLMCFFLIEVAVRWEVAVHMCCMSRVCVWLCAIPSNSVPVPVTTSLALKHSSGFLVIIVANCQNLYVQDHGGCHWGVCVEEAALLTRTECPIGEKNFFPLGQNQCGTTMKH